MEDDAVCFVVETLSVKRLKVFGGMILALLIHTHTYSCGEDGEIYIFKVSLLHSSLKGSMGALSVFTNPVYPTFNTYKL